MQMKQQQQQYEQERLEREQKERELQKELELQRQKEREAAAAAAAAIAAAEEEERQKRQQILQQRKRFLVELEFVQCLANPNYLKFLAVRGYFENESFKNYLKYLVYWKTPEYIKFIKYPECLYFLDLILKKLQNEEDEKSNSMPTSSGNSSVKTNNSEGCNENSTNSNSKMPNFDTSSSENSLKNPKCINFIVEQQLLHWKYFVRNRDTERLNELNNGNDDLGRGSDDDAAEENVERMDVDRAKNSKIEKNKKSYKNSKKYRNLKRSRSCKKLKNSKKFKKLKSSSNQPNNINANDVNKDEKSPIENQTKNEEKNGNLVEVEVLLNNGQNEPNKTINNSNKKVNNVVNSLKMNGIISSKPQNNTSPNNHNSNNISNNINSHIDLVNLDEALITNGGKNLSINKNLVNGSLDEQEHVNGIHINNNNINKKIKEVSFFVSIFV
jgi:hypothetical protein